MAAPRWVASALLAATFGALYLVAVCSPFGQRLDIVAFSQAQTWNPTLEPWVGALRQGIPAVLAVLFAVLVVRGLTRRAVAPVTRAVLSVVAATALAWVLKQVLDRPFLLDAGYVENTFPSGHVAVSAALVLSALSLWPATSRRTFPAAGFLVILAACLVNVVGHAHRPSDTIGAVVLAGTVQLALAGKPSQRVHPAGPDPR